MKKIMLIFMLLSSLHAEDFFINIKGSYPQKFSFELLIPVKRFLFIGIEPGTAGQKLHFGVGKVQGATGAVWGSRVSLTYLHMNEDNGAYISGSNYIGMDALAMAMFGIINVGLLFDLDTGEPRLSFGLGLGI